ncbi:MAG: F0F1 ATP synthase subunit B [Clostridia bacterium]|nr:F0F1 ATP synthase subunit B [Clostridia bacterium]
MNFNLPDIAVDLLLNVINIVVLFIIVKALVYKPVKKFLDQRNQRIKDETAEAQKLTDAANETLSQKDSILEESREKGEAIAADIYKKAQQKANTIIAKAESDAKAMKEKAQSEIDAQKEDMIKSSKDDIADLSIEIAEKILQREVNKEDNKKIVEEFFKEV